MYTKKYDMSEDPRPKSEIPRRGMMTGKAENAKLMVKRIASNEPINGLDNTSASPFVKPRLLLLSFWLFMFTLDSGRKKERKHKVNKC